MGEKSAPYLHLVRQTPSGSSDNAAPSDAASSDDQGHDQGHDQAPAALNQPLQQAIMYAAVSWVALCVERSVYAVDIQPIARNLYEVSIHYADPETGQEAAGAGIILRVRLNVERGLAVETLVEPVHPS